MADKPKLKPKRPRLRAPAAPRVGPTPLRVYRAELSKLLGAVQRGELELEAAHAQLAKNVLAQLPEAVKGRRSTAELEAIFDAEFAKTFPARVRIVRQSIRAGADAGPAASQQTFRAVMGDEVLDAQVRATSAAMSEAADRIAGRITVDKVGLTKRMRRVDREVSQQMATEVQRGIRQKRGILGAARKIERIDPRAVELPQYLQDLEAAARAGDKGAVRDIARSYAGRIAKLGEAQTDGTFIASKYSLKSATKKFVREVQTASDSQLDSVVKRYVQDKLAFQANRIARSETVEAMRQSYVKQTADKPGVVCFEWRLSNRHEAALHGGSKMDVCDILANQNAYGLGPGRYPAEHVPAMPHPNCLCTVHAVIDRKFFDRPADEDGQVPEDMQDHESPDAAGWLAANPDKARAILGPTRHALLEKGVPVLEPTGQPKRVGDLLKPGARKAVPR
jgi:hypothetical protein